MSVDTASVRIDAPAETVFAFMADASKLTLWSFGTWSTTIDATGLVEGRALQSGAPVFLRIDADRGRMLVDYHLGSAPDALRPRIFARIIPAEVTGHAAGCTLIMTALRAVDMDDARWHRMIRAHAFEVDVIASLIETGHDHRAPS